MAVPQSIRLPDDHTAELEADRDATGSRNASEHLRGVIEDGLRWRRALRACADEPELSERLRALVEHYAERGDR